MMDGREIYRIHREFYGPGFLDEIFKMFEPKEIKMKEEVQVAWDRIHALLPNKVTSEDALAVRTIQRAIFGDRERRGLNFGRRREDPK